MLTFFFYFIKLWIWLLVMLSTQYCLTCSINQIKCRSKYIWHHLFNIILIWCLFFIVESFDPSITVCPYHRYTLGIHWKPSRKCGFPSHKGMQKPQRAVSKEMSQNILHTMGVLVVIGEGNELNHICMPCHLKLNQPNIPDSKLNVGPVLARCYHLCGGNVGINIGRM